MAEWSIAAVLKTASLRNRGRGFESLPLRQTDGLMLQHARHILDHILGGGHWRRLRLAVVGWPFGPAGGVVFAAEVSADHRQAALREHLA